MQKLVAPGKHAQDYEYLIRKPSELEEEPCIDSDLMTWP